MPRFARTQQTSRSIHSRFGLAPWRCGSLGRSRPAIAEARLSGSLDQRASHLTRNPQASLAPLVRSGQPASCSPQEVPCLRQHLVRRVAFATACEHVEYRSIADPLCLPPAPCRGSAERRCPVVHDVTLRLRVPKLSPRQSGFYRSGIGAVKSEPITRAFVHAGSLLPAPAWFPRHAQTTLAGVRPDELRGRQSTKPRGRNALDLGGPPRSLARSVRRRNDVWRVERWRLLLAIDDLLDPSRSETRRGGHSSAGGAGLARLQDELVALSRQIAYVLGGSIELDDHWPKLLEHLVRIHRHG